MQNPYTSPQAELADPPLIPSPEALPSVRVLLADAFDIFRTHASTILAITLLVYVPIDLVLEALPSADGDDFRSIAQYFRVQRSLEYFFGVLATMAI